MCEYGVYPNWLFLCLNNRCIPRLSRQLLGWDNTNMRALRREEKLNNIFSTLISALNFSFCTKKGSCFPFFDWVSISCRIRSVSIYKISQFPCFLLQAEEPQECLQQSYTIIYSWHWTSIQEVYCLNWVNNLEYWVLIELSKYHEHNTDDKLFCNIKVRKVRLIKMRGFQEILTYNSADVICKLGYL